MAATELVRASVTQVSPLKVRVDGATTTNAAEALPGFVPVVGARVWAATVGRQLLVLAGGGGAGAAPTKAQIDALDVDADTLDGFDSTAFLRTKAQVDALGVDAGTLDGIDSTAFLRVTQDTGWLAPAYVGSWATYGDGGVYGAAAYRRLPTGRVVMRGMVVGGASGTSIFTLPVGYRPTKQLITVALASSGAGRVDVQTGGGVTWESSGSPAWLSLALVSFMADQ